MNTEIRVPKIPNAGVKLSIGRWFKRAGDAVTLGEPLVEITADAITHEVRAPVRECCPISRCGTALLSKLAACWERSVSFERASAAVGSVAIVFNLSNAALWKATISSRQQEMTAPPAVRAVAHRAISRACA
jgi:hypothetical protein